MDIFSIFFNMTYQLLDVLKLDLSWSTKEK